MIPAYLHTFALPTPFPVGPVNVYLALGDEPTLVDTGPNDPETLAALRNQLARVGLAFRDIRRVIVTHAHVDHFGLAPQIVEESGAAVYSHARNRGWLTDYQNEWLRRGEFYRAVFAASGAPPEILRDDELGQGMRSLTRYGTSISPGNFTEIKEGDRLQLNRDEWRVIFSPGHAGGLVCLYEANSATLLSNDHLLRDITSNPVLEPPARGESKRPRALVDYMASMRRTAEMNVAVALPGHGESIPDVRALIESRLAFHRARCDVIESQVRRGISSAYELMGILFPNLKGMDLFLGLSEVVGHLDVLEDEQRIWREDRDGVWYYQIRENKN